jgi:single-strand DNA-binding protein
MLDGRAGEGDRDVGGGGYERGGFSGGAARTPSSGPREDFSASLDDEIPF